MGTVTKRTLKNGTIRYRAEIKLKQKGRIIYQESHTFSSDKNANEWIKKKEADILINGISTKSSFTLKELIKTYIDDYSHRVRMGRTKKMDLNKLYHADIARIYTQDLTSADYIKHINKRLDTGVLPQTANNDIAWIKVVLEFGIAACNASADLSELQAAKSFLKSSGLIARSNKRERIPTAEEHTKIIEYISRKDGRRSIPMLDILQFAMTSSRRLSEITRIEWSDNDKDHKTGIVKDLKHPRYKEGNHKVFKYTDKAWNIAQNQLKTDRFIFPYNPRTISAYFTRTCKFLDIKDLHFHDYRHLATTWLFTEGLQIHEVSEYTLHESWDMLKRYTQLSEQNKLTIKEIYNATQ